MPSHCCTFTYCRAGQCESIFAMIRSARAIASEMADSDAGECLPSHCVSLRAARMQAAISSTRFLPSSTLPSVAHSPFIRYRKILPHISNFGICTVGQLNSRTAWNRNLGMQGATRFGARGGSSAPTVAIPQPDRVCRGGGKSIRAGRNDCGKCAVEGATKRLIEAAKIGRLVAHTTEALAKEGRTQRQQAKARSLWTASRQPSWLTPETYSGKIKPQSWPDRRG